jgi:hypothetical protein
MVETSQRAQRIDLADFFSASEARTDRWRQLSPSGVWESAAASAQPDEVFHAEAGRLFAELSPLEGYWAHPRPRLSAAVAQAIEEHNAGVFARLVQRISSILLTGSYRYESLAWDALRRATPAESKLTQRGWRPACTLAERTHCGGWSSSLASWWRRQRGCRFGFVSQREAEGASRNKPA